jgi:hypothetical protein
MFKFEESLKEKYEKELVGMPACVCQKGEVKNMLK